MRLILIILVVLGTISACGSGQDNAPPPEKGVLLNPKSDTLPDKEVLGPDEDDDLGHDEIIDEENRD